MAEEIKKEITKPSGKKFTLQVTYEPYERYEQTAPRRLTIHAKSEKGLLMALADNLGLYIDSEEIEEDKDFNVQKYIDEIEDENGDGCDWISRLSINGKVYIDEVGEDDDQEITVDESCAIKESEKMASKLDKESDKQVSTATKSLVSSDEIKDTEAQKILDKIHQYNGEDKGVEEDYHDSQKYEAIVWDNIPTMERRPTTQDDVDKGWHKLTFSATDDLAAIKKLVIDNNIVAADEPDDWTSLEDAVDWLDGQDYGFGDPIILRVTNRTTNEDVYDSGCSTKEEFFRGDIIEDEDDGEDYYESLSQISTKKPLNNKGVNEAVDTKGITVGPFTSEETKKYSSELNDFCKQKDPDAYFETYWDVDFNHHNEPVISVDINWGDWKHEHLWFDELARQFFESKNIEIKIDTNVTEEDGSDTYSATHVIHKVGPSVTELTGDDAGNNVIMIKAKDTTTPVNEEEESH